MATKRVHPEVQDHGWEETRDWHPWDRRLRAKGFRIYARPKRGPTKWIRGKTVYTEFQAMQLYKAEAGL